jgi:hypothetical protein
MTKAGGSGKPGDDVPMDIDDMDMENVADNNQDQEVVRFSNTHTSRLTLIKFKRRRRMIKWTISSQPISM